MPGGRPKKERALSAAERKLKWKASQGTKTPDSGTKTLVAGTETVNRSQSTKNPGWSESLLVQPVATVAEVVTSSVTYVDKLKVEPGLLRDRMALRARLDALKEEWAACQRRGDYVGCRRVNEEREPLFEALWALEKDMSDRYWFPTRIIGQGQSFAK